MREAGRPVIVPSEDRRTEMKGLKAFLFAKVYRHPRVMHVMRGAEQIVADLFARYMAEPGEMPPPWRNAGDWRSGARGRGRRLRGRHDGPLRHQRAPALV